MRIRQTKQLTKWAVAFSYMYINALRVTKRLQFTVAYTESLTAGEARLAVIYSNALYEPRDVCLKAYAWRWHFIGVYCARNNLSGICFRLTLRPACTKADRLCCALYALRTNMFLRVPFRAVACCRQATHANANGTIRRQ